MKRAALLVLPLLGPAAALAEPVSSEGADVTAKAVAPVEPELPLSSAPSLGLAPDLPLVGTSIGPAPRFERPPGAPGEYRFGFHGYFRAPLRLGLNGDEDPSRTQIHSPAWVPDGTSRREGVPEDYRLWQYTHQAPTPWTQLNLSYGSDRVRATVIIASHTLSDGAYNNLSAQLGINQAFVTIAVPRLLGGRLAIDWNVGSFSNRYGAMGPQDAGRYETYLIGRTHVVGETVTATYQAGAVDFVFEHGFGGKMDRVTDPAKVTANAELLRQDQVGSTLLHHAHFGVSFARQLLVGAHYMRSWVQDRKVTAEDPRPAMTVLAGDVRVQGGRFGDGYLAVARVSADNVLYLANAIESVHAPTTLSFAENYLDARIDQREGVRSGNVTTIGGQYGASLRRLLGLGGAGGPRDLHLAGFGIYQTIVGRDAAAGLSYKKIKFGGDVYHAPLSWLAVALRYDRVTPVVGDDARSFSVISPRIILRSELLANEQVIIGYSRYFYGSSVVAPPLDGQTALTGPRLDDQLLYFAAVLWW